MKAARVALFLVLAITFTNAKFKLDSISLGSETSLGSYYGSADVGNLTKKYHALEPVDAKASKNAVDLLELLRRIFSVGIFTLPPLDPFSSTQLKPLILQSDSFISGKVFLKSLIITGAKHFEVKSFEARMKTGRVDFDIHFPKLNIKVDLQADLYLHGLVPLSTRGQLSIQIYELQFTGALQTEARRLEKHGPEVYQVTGASFQLRAKDVKFTIDNGMHLEEDLLQTVFDAEDKALFSQWIEKAEDTINKYAINTFIYQTNKVLRGLSVAQVNAFLIPEDNIKD